MTKTDKFNDKKFITMASMPSELFTVRGIKSEYRKLAKIWHPDISKDQDALIIMGKINSLYHEGLSLIEQNMFYEKERLIYRNGKKESPKKEKTKKDADINPVKRSRKKLAVEIKKTDGTCVKLRYIKRLEIELGQMYVSEEYILLEISKLKKRIFLDAYTQIKSISKDGSFPTLPNLIDSFESKTHGYLVFKKKKGIEPVSLLSKADGYQKLTASRKICEGILKDLVWLKSKGLTTTAFESDLWFLDIDTGDFYNFGCCFYLHKFTDDLLRMPKAISDKAFSVKSTNNETKIVKIIKNTVIEYNIQNGLSNGQFHKWITSITEPNLDDLFKESVSLNKGIGTVTTSVFNLENYYDSIQKMAV